MNKKIKIKIKKINKRQEKQSQALADDLVLLTEHRIHMQILLEECKDFLDQKGLMANAGKCASLRVVPVAKKKSMKVITKVHRK